MIERCLLILPSLNNALSRHGTPMSVRDTEALQNIASDFEPSKRAILSLCQKEATLRHADLVFKVLLRDLGKVQRWHRCCTNV